jgi:glycerol-3-phosphate acyltransferase PlsX
MHIGIDMMGGDFAPAATVQGVLLAAEELKAKANLVLIGNERIIREEFSAHGLSADAYTIVDAQSVIEMGEHPARAFTQKSDSSIAVGFQLLKEGKIQAFAGAGNTGAMLVGSVLSIGTIDGVQRPCIMSLIPKEKGGYGILLDVGSNADCKADVLYQFAVLGSLYVKTVFGKEKPRVALLNIGEEESKGNLLTVAAHKLMAESDEINFIGNIKQN